MRVREFLTMVRTPAAAWRALRQRRWPTRRMPACLVCGARHTYRLREGRWRCPRRACSYTFGVRTGTWAGLSRVPDDTWLWLVKLFELELTARQAAVQTGVSYPTALKAFTLLRRAILAEAEPELLRREVEADESYFGPRRPPRSRGDPRNRGRSAPHKTPVFGILERHGRVQVSVVPDCSAETLRDRTLRWVKRGTLVYTDQWSGYDTLTFCGYRHLRVNHARHFSRGKVHINGLEGFWSYAKTKFVKHHGVSPARFPLYLYEWQFRYNHRQENLFDLLLAQSLRALPNL
ncbi:IS1595 family transposase [Roseisolibacter sp. H3M3-2]|uniref:IS1595 family transposase n=1 Tax=Roseisolibacter sp. H3M3-2 TaxID=3031323 RepID=UPI0023DC33AE|nr:IS1595 family transposase [Roseisolibacter sp. H3M3-2]MDF1506413.1 IS1595 family transposase [Roseisolibacter sp. H3M3-2]